MARFEPVSREHEGFVDILHVGRSDDAGFFYYQARDDDMIISALREPAWRASKWAMPPAMGTA